MGNQVVHFVFARAGYEVWRRIGINADYVLHLRNSFYNDYPDIHRRAPEFRVGVRFGFGE